MQGLGLKPRPVNGASVLPEIASADNFDASARVAGPAPSPGLGLAKPAALPEAPSQPVDASPVPSPELSAPSASPQAAQPAFDFHKNPMGAIALALANFGAGFQGKPLPSMELQKQQMEQQAAGYQTAELGLRVIESATKQLNGRPASEHGAIIADFDKRFSGALGGMSIKPMLEAISSGQIKDAAKKLELGKSLGIFTPQVLAYYEHDPVGLDKLLSTVMEHKATEETPAQAGAKAAAVTAATEANKPRETQIVDVGDKKVLTYKDTGETIKEFPVGTTAAEANAASAQYNTESNNLRGEFVNNSKPFVAIRDAFQTMKAAAKNPTPAGDLSIIFGYMKMLDPTSTVREGEAAQTAQAPGVPATILNWYNRAVNGEPLLDSRRKDIMDRAQSFYTVKENLQKAHEGEYGRLAKSRNIKGEDVVVDYKPKELQTVSDPAAAMKLAPGTHFLDSNGVERIRP